jgi:putative pyrroloquinoline-quinone binding quinoprotein
VIVPRGMAALGLVALLVLLAACTREPAAPQQPPLTLPSGPGTSAAPPAAGDGDWTTYHRDNARSGYLAGMADPTRLTEAWSARLDGAVYGEPLVVGDRVLVATEADSLYALELRSGRVQWRANVGEPVPLSELPCGNIDPLGITGTPVYDPGTGLVFAVAEVTGPAHVLVGVDARSGRVRVRRSVDVPGMPPQPHQQRAALALSQGRVYIAYGGLLGDCGDYYGRVAASRTDGRGPLQAFQVPTSREGGIWGASGPAVDGHGRLYVAVGNGAATDGEWDHSDSVLRLSPELRLEDGFAPTRWPQDNAADADLGSMGPLLPGGLVFAAGKSGLGYLLRADHLGGVGGQLAERPVCAAFGGAAAVG